MSNKPLVSILVSYYNDELFLEENITSILNQSYSNIELILLNHASTDNSRNIAHLFNDSRIKHIDYPQNTGAYSGVLTIEMLKLAQGKYIKVFSADDVLLNDGLEKLVNYMESHPHIDFAFGNVEYIDNNSKSYNDTWFNNRNNFDINDNNLTCLKKLFNCQSILPYAGQIIKKEILKEKYFDKTYIMFYDVMLWTQLLAEGYSLAFINDIVANYRIHDKQTTGIKNKLIADKRGYFEDNTRRQYWSECKNLQLIKELFNDSSYINLLDKEEDIPFIVNEYFLNKYEDVIAYYKLHEMMNSTEYINYLNKKFNFTINDFRKLISKVPKPQPPVKMNWRKEARNKAWDLNYIQILYLLLHKLIKFEFLKNKNIKKEKENKDEKPKQYSL